MPIITFVTPWYGPEVPGGAEAETRRTAHHLRQAGMDVEVLTTCARDLYSDWGQNHHRPGVTVEDGITVRRFAVQPRDSQSFDQINWRLIHDQPIAAEAERTFIEQMIRAPDLYDFIRQHRQGRLYVFIPYMFATTYYGAQIHPDRSVMIPCLHDESYARLGIYQDILPNVKGLVLHTRSERNLADQLFTPANGQIRTVLGEGVDSDFSGDGERFRQKYDLDGPLILTLGRREAGKNTPLLVDYWTRYWQAEGQSRGSRLLLAGPGEIVLPPTPASGVVDLGFIPRQDKYDAYAAAEIFCLPSVNESFSIVTMESWLSGTPALVNAHCDVMVEHCQRSNGGLYFANYEEFAAMITYLLDRPLEARRMGDQGRAYVLDNYGWDRIVDRYRALFDEVLASE